MKRPRNIFFALVLLAVGCGGGESVSVLLDPEVRLLRTDLPVPQSLSGALHPERRWGLSGWVRDLPRPFGPGPARRDAASPATLSGTVALSLDPDRRTLAGQAALVIQAGNQGASELSFSLNAAGVDAVLCDPMSCGHEFSGSTLTVTLDTPAAAAEQLTIDISWHDSGIEQVWDDFPEGGGPILANLLDSPSSYFTFGYAFFPRLHGEAGTPELSFAITFPGSRSAVLSGEFLSTQANGDGTTTSSWRLAYRPGRAVTLALGNYDSISGSCGASTLELYYLPGTSIDGYPIVAETYRPILAALCAHYLERFGAVPVPVVRVAGVDDRFRNGYSAPGLIVVPNYTFDDDGTGSFIERDFYLAHELSHQWWGDAVTVAAASDLWLIEGMADYAAASALERSRSAEDGRYLWLWEARPLVELWQRGEPEHPLVPTAGSNLDPRIYYIKGAWVLRMLETLMGSEGLDGLLLELATQFRDQALSSNDFTQRAAAKAGQDLDWFFEQWLTGTGALELVSSHRQDGSRLSLTVTQQRPWSPQRYFRAPLTIRLGYQQRAADRQATIEGEQTELELELP